jgi:hypothetical protein
LSRAGLPRDVSGLVVDLRPHDALLKADGGFRIMIYQQAARLLKKRGASRVILPDRAAQ